MPRTPVVTRLATIADVSVLVSLWNELRNVGARAERAVNPVATPDVEAAFAAAMSDADKHVILACVDGQPAGMAVCRTVEPDPLSDSRVLQMSHVVVTRQHRRRGVGHALLAAAVEIADAEQLEHIGVEIYPSVRDASRFYARLGFAPVTVRRVAPLAVLRRRLASDGPVTRTDEMLRRRTRVRRPLPAQRAAIRRTSEPVD